MHYRVCVWLKLHKIGGRLWPLVATINATTPIRDMRACGVRIKLRLNNRRIIIELMVLKVQGLHERKSHTRSSLIRFNFCAKISPFRVHTFSLLPWKFAESNEISAMINTRATFHKAMAKEFNRTNVVSQRRSNSWSIISFLPVLATELFLETL